MGTTSIGPVGSTGGTDDPIECASPDFKKEPTDPQLYQCVGEEIGAFEFDLCVFGSCKSRQSLPIGLDDNDDGKIEPIPFPNNLGGLNVATCCTSNVVDEPTFADNACVADCARATCMLSLDLFEYSIANPETTMKCLTQACVDEVIGSLTHYRNYLQAHMDSCLMAAEKLPPGNVMSLDDPSCAEKVLKPTGCLVNARLVLGSATDDDNLVSCALTVADLSAPIESVCESSQNHITADPDRGQAVLTGGRVQLRGHDSVDVALWGGSIRTAEYSCEVGPCAFVLEEFSVKVEDFDLGPISFQDVHAELSHPALGSIEGEEVAFAAGSIEMRITGSLVGANGAPTEPLTMVADNAAAAYFWRDSVTISSDDVFFDLGLFTASAAIEPCTRVAVQ